MKMLILNVWTWLLLFSVFNWLFFESEAATHWVVTENGMIQSHVSSPMELRRPYDLIALLDQENRWNEIQMVYDDLKSRKNLIEKKWNSLNGASGAASGLALKQEDCLINKKSFDDIELHSQIAMNGSDRLKIELSLIDHGDRVPDCTKYSQVHFSASAYKHFPSLYSENNITLVSKTFLEPFLPVSSLQIFGDAIERELEKNSTSWVHYNLAALYWRMKGNGPKAVDCSRKALFHVVSEYRDIPLHNLAGILNQGNRSKEAALLLHTALEYAPEQAVHYLGLGHVYFSLRDFNSSFRYYEKFLELKPNDKSVFVIKNITQCLSKIGNYLIHYQEKVLGILKKILSDTDDFHSQQQHWLRLNEKLMWEHSSSNIQSGSFDDLVNVKQHCVHKASSSKSVMTYDFVDNPTIDSMRLQTLFTVVKNQKDILDHLSQTELNKEFDFKIPIVYNEKFPNNMFTSRNLYFDGTGWPSSKECAKWNLPLNEKQDLSLPVFLPPENKGFQVNKILSEFIDLLENVEHKLPWYPPNCKGPDISVENLIQPLDPQLLNNDLKSSEFLKNHFLSYINDGKADEAEIGQRIITAMEKKSAPKWVLATLASLYWRVRGNTRKALDCLDLAFQTVPKEQTDVVLVSVGSIMHELGLVNHALKFANLAFKLNYVEPSTNFLLALLHYDNNNPLLAMYYMKNVLRVDPEYYNNQAEILLKIWSCRIKLGYHKDKLTDKASLKRKTEQFCFKNEDGTCQSSSVQCVKTKHLDGVEIMNSIKGKDKITLGNSLISTLLNSQGPKNILLDNSNNPDNAQQSIHMKIFFGNDKTTAGNTIEEFYVALNDEDENKLHVYDKSGTHSLSPQGCKKILEADSNHISSIFKFLVARNINIARYLKPSISSKKDLKPYCLNNPSAKSPIDQLIDKILQKQLPNSPERNLEDSLSFITNNEKSSAQEIGSKISFALQENSTSWLLANAAAIYWRIIGRSEEAIICLKLALSYVPHNMRDVLLINLASLLQRIGLYSDAFEVAYSALKSHPNLALNYYMVGKIFSSLGDLEEAFSCYKASLALDSNFEPARNSLQAILCTLLFDGSESLRDLGEN